MVLGRGSREPCGLKFRTETNNPQSYWSRLARALWIEIPLLRPGWCHSGSRLARALWIEILEERQMTLMVYVEARESLVD